MVAPRLAKWELVSRHPYIYHCPNFLSPGECNTFMKAARLGNNHEARSMAHLRSNSSQLQPQESALLQDVERQVGVLSGVQVHEGETPWTIKRKLPSSIQPAPPTGFLRRWFGGKAVASSNRIEKGLHIDTNHTSHRWLTFITYLHTTPPLEGGHTVFPLARQLGSTEAGSELQCLGSAADLLVSSGFQHTDHAKKFADPSAYGSQIRRASQSILAQAEHIAEEAASCTHSCVYFDPAGIGLAVPAIQGSCVAFFSRSPETGAVDPLSFHGGAALMGSGSGSRKWTLQRFREAPVDEAAFEEIEAFVVQAGSLKT